MSGSLLKKRNKLQLFLKLLGKALILFSMRKNIRLLKAILILMTIGFAGCKHKPFEPEKTAEVVDDNFPKEISAIFIAKCATAGCHNKASHQLSGGGFLLDSWEHLFEGGNHGAAIIPYSPENSSLLYFINSHSEFGAIPPDDMKMPLNRDPLSREEYLLIRDWIIKGAPDKNGNIPFATNPTTRQKIYLAHQGCDYVTVIDCEKHVAMRMIPVGKEITIETAQSLTISPDGNSAYISFWGSQYVDEINTNNDSIVSHIDIGYPNSTMLSFSPDGLHLLLTSRYANALIRINPGTRQKSATHTGGFVKPLGIATNQASNLFYVTEQYGNMVYKIPMSGTITKVSIDGNIPIATGTNTPGAYNIAMTPDYSKYFVTCEATNELRVMDAATDQLIKIIPVGKTPQEIAISKQQPYLFVTCLEDSTTNPLFKGSVYIINYNTLEIVKKINDRYYMPHALAVDDKYGMLYVFNRNIDANGPTPHHGSSVCQGRIGYYSIYDINALQPLNNRRYEVTIDPYSAEARFK